MPIGHGVEFASAALFGQCAGAIERSECVGGARAQFGLGRAVVGLKDSQRVVAKQRSGSSCVCRGVLSAAAHIHYTRRRQFAGSDRRWQRHPHDARRQPCDVGAFESSFTRATATPTASDTSTDTATPTASDTATYTLTPTDTNTATSTDTATYTASPTQGTCKRANSSKINAQALISCTPCAIGSTNGNTTSSSGFGFMGGVGFTGIVDRKRRLSRRVRWMLWALSVIVLLSGCTGGNPTATVVPTATCTPTPIVIIVTSTPIPVATHTPTVVNTPTPIYTPINTFTPTPMSCSISLVLSDPNKNNNPAYPGLLIRRLPTAKSNPIVVPKAFVPWGAIVQADKHFIGASDEWVHLSDPSFPVGWMAIQVGSFSYIANSACANTLPAPYTPKQYSDLQLSCDQNAIAAMVANDSDDLVMAHIAFAESATYYGTLGSQGGLIADPRGSKFLPTTTGSIVDSDVTNILWIIRLRAFLGLVNYGSVQTKSFHSRNNSAHQTRSVSLFSESIWYTNRSEC